MTSCWNAAEDSEDDKGAAKGGIEDLAAQAATTHLQLAPASAVLELIGRSAEPHGRWQLQQAVGRFLGPSGAARCGAGSPVHRRLAFMLRRLQTVANIGLTIQQDLPQGSRDPSRHRTGTASDAESAQHRSGDAAEVQTGHGHPVDQVRPVGRQLPIDYSQLQEQYDFIPVGNVLLGLVMPKTQVVSEADVHLQTVAGLVVSYLASLEV